MNETVSQADLSAVGVDIAKAKFDACLWRPKPLLKTFANTPEGCAAFLAWLAEHDVTQAHVCLEATSTYGDALARYCHERGQRVSLVNPARIKAFGQACGLRNKTDSADARLIAEFCARQRPRPWTALAPEVATLRELMRHWTDLSGWLAAQKCRLDTAGPSVRGFIQREIEFLEEQIRDVRKAVNAHLRQHAELWKKIKLLETIPGIGRQNAARLLAELPQGLETAREAAAYVGVTPRRNESGAIVRRSCLSRQGKACVRPGLYLAAMNAFRFNAPCRALAERLLAKGMTKKAVVVAVMHKLLRIAFGVLKHQKPFDPKWAEAAFPSLAASSPA
jgi:transposase